MGKFLEASSSSATLLVFLNRRQDPLKLFARNLTLRRGLNHCVRRQKLKHLFTRAAVCSPQYFLLNHLETDGGTLGPIKLMAFRVLHLFASELFLDFCRLLFGGPFLSAGQGREAEEQS